MKFPRATHLPLERQVKMMERQGLIVESQTLWDQIQSLARKLQPAYERLHSRLLVEPVLGADETPWKLLGNGGRKTKQWYAWAIASPIGVLYRIDARRSAEAATHLLRNYSGALVCDGYTAYGALRKQGASFKIAHCWAHARRKFFEIQDQHPEACSPMLDLIGQLYEVERTARDGPPEQLKERRQHESRSILEKIREHMNSIRSLPETPLRRALDYLEHLWPGLCLFLDEPNISLYNNAVERVLRTVVVGRKNHYGSKSQRGTEVAALFYSLIESAKLNGIMPDDFLKLALQKALDDEEIPLPHELVESEQTA